MAATSARIPETSVNLGLNLGFVQTAYVDGQAVPGSDSVLGSLQIAVATIFVGRIGLLLPAVQEHDAQLKGHGHHARVGHQFVAGGLQPRIVLDL